MYGFASKNARLHALKGQQHIAQGKRSDTLGQSTFVSDAL